MQIFFAFFGIYHQIAYITNLPQLVDFSTGSQKRSEQVWRVTLGYSQCLSVHQRPVHLLFFYSTICFLLSTFRFRLSTNSGCFRECFLCLCPLVFATL